jgi:hypothetical protein
MGDRNSTSSTTYFLIFSYGLSPIGSHLLQFSLIDIMCYVVNSLLSGPIPTQVWVGIGERTLHVIINYTEIEKIFFLILIMLEET